MLRLPRAVLALLLAGTLPGCLGLHYVLHAAEGEAELLAARKPLDEVIASPRTPARVRALLSQIPRVKEFGEANGLRPTGNYDSYVRLHRRAAVYVVSACEKLRFHSRTWSFPIAGEFPYLGWFNAASALDYGKDLADEGFDVDVRGASAFSTLGHFKDPVLSTMIERGPEALGELAETVLHESAHATLHLDGQALFNESLAQFVGETLAQRFLAGDLRALTAWEAQKQRGAAQEKLLHAAYEELDALYKSAATDAEKLARKEDVLARLQTAAGARRPFTNATLLQHRTYRAGTEGFPALLAACGGELQCFLARLRTLKKESFEKPEQEDLDPVLLPLAGRAG